MENDIQILFESLADHVARDEISYLRMVESQDANQGKFHLSFGQQGDDIHFILMLKGDVNERKIWIFEEDDGGDHDFDRPIIIQNWTPSMVIALVTRAYK